MKQIFFFGINNLKVAVSDICLKLFANMFNTPEKGAILSECLLQAKCDSGSDPIGKCP